ncbi:MAG: DUF4046 domain-containing protein, partial [Candidatus Margulisbacteria bacterium]|nr:DUF4046 domain-containing protein [Candidatus Margulisiibacteriota bacterium]
MTRITPSSSSPFTSRWKSMAAARPHLDAYTAQRLKRLLNDPLFRASSLRLAETERVARGKYLPDLELLIGDKLSMIEGMSKAELIKLYVEKMSPVVQEVYEEVLDGSRKTFPDRFWSGRQGQLNMIICFRYLLEQKLGFQMQRSPQIIDSRFFRQNQGEFLVSEVGKEDWTAFCAKYKLGGGLNLTFANSFSQLIRTSYPWAFNLNSKEGSHLHPDDFRTNDTWQGSKGRKLAGRMADHRFRRHLGLTMDEKTKTFDPRLLRENQAELLASLGYTCWRDVFY